MSEITDWLERFRRGAELVAVATTGAANPELDFVPGPGRWTARQVVCHLADAELVAAERFRRVIAEENAVIQAYDEKAWAAKLDYHRRKISQALEGFRRTRADNYDLLKDLPEAAYQRGGIHSERGPQSLMDLLRIYTEHAENHARQILDARRLYKEARRQDNPPGTRS